MAEIGRRKRRTPKEARALILEVAENRLAAHGPEGLKVADVARDAGIAHSTLLHHFGSTAELQKDLVDQMVQRLLRDILEQLSGEKLGGVDGFGILQKVFAVLADRGHARLMAWLMLTGQRTDTGQEIADRLLYDVVEAIYAQSVAEGRPITPDTKRDAKFAVYLAAIAAMGDGLSGPVLAPIIGLSEEEAHDGFRHWLSDLLSNEILAEKKTDRPVGLARAALTDECP